MSQVNPLPGSASIQFLSGPEQGQVFPLAKQRIAIGREPSQNDIIPTELTISRTHAQIMYINGNWSIVNVSQNNNNLTVNQQKILSNQQRILQDNDIVGIGEQTSFRISMRPSASGSMPGIARSYQPLTPPPPGSGGSGMRPPLQPSPAGGQQTQDGKTMRAPQPGMSAIGTLPSFEISTNTKPGKQTYQLPLNQPTISIGHDKAANDLYIDEPIVSSQHFQIVRENNQLVLIHPHPLNPKHMTTNGLYYEGRHIQGHEQFRKPLMQGDVFRIGNAFGTLVTLTYNDGSGRVREQVPTLPSIQLGAPQITIGRGPDNMVVLTHPQISARHARLVQDQGAYRIIDMGSTNHVYVNGQRVTNQRLNVGDEIRIGPYKLTFTGTQLTQHDESKSIRIDAVDLKKVGNNQKVLINDISISIPPGKFVALVGGSGAGKSTLMDALNGLRPASNGHVFYNGQDYYNSLASFRTQLGYVPQADIVHTDLTVDKALYYAAKLRLPEDYTESQIQQRISEVLVDVDMTHRRKLLISKLSGGQRKRVSIALELLAKPSVFFLDEPTSGLDPGLDRKMMLLLRKLADQGHTIVLVTHATNNIISNCDYVCFLCQDGRLAYFGPPDEAMAYFNQSDFADIYSALEPNDDTPEGKQIPAKAEARFKASQEYQRYVAAPLHTRPASRTGNMALPAGDTRLKRGNPGKQFALLSQRYIELLKNDKVNLAILLLQAPIIGLILMGLIEYVLPKDIFTTSTILDRTGGGVNAEKTLFIMAFAAIMFGCINSAREIVKEDAIYRRERAVNLGIAPYLFSKIIVLGVLCLLQSAILLVMVNLVSPLTGGILLPAFVEIYITMALTSLNGLMIGLALSALAPNNDRAMSFVPLILIPQVIFSGILFKLDGIAQVLSAFFAARWAMVGMGSTIGLVPCYVGSDNFSFQGTVEQNTPTCPPGNSGDVISQATATGHLLLTWLVLALMIIILGFATAYFLKQKDAKVR